MASEWVPSVVGGVIALVGIGAAYYSTHTQQRTMLKLSREERRWNKRVTAYESLLDYCARIDNWVTASYKLVTGAGEEFGMSAMEQVPDMHRLVVLAVYWSDEIEALMAAHKQEVQKFWMYGGQIAFEQQARKERPPGVPEPNPGHFQQLMLELPARKEVVYDAGTKVKEQVNLELMSDPAETSPRKWYWPFA